MPKFSAYMRGEGVKGDTGKNASFNEISATSHISNFPEVTISTSGPDDQKNINFDFGFVSGPSGGFSTNQNANIQFTEVGSLPSVSITTDDASPNNSKVFNFDFKIPEPKNIVNIEQTILSTTSEGENEITISYNDNSSTTFIVHNGAQGTPSFIQGAVSTTSELPDNNNYTGQAFLVGDDEENKKLYVYLENEWKYQGSISGAGFGEPTGSIEMVSFTTSKIYTGDKILKLEKTEENNLEIESAKIYLQPIQDLHGQSAPYPAGGGVNILPTITAGTYTSGDLTAVVGTDGKITVTGTKTVGNSATISFPDFSTAFAIPLNYYFHLRNSSAVSGVSLAIAGASPSLSPQNRIYQNTTERTPVVTASLIFNADASGTYNFTLQPSIEAGGSVTSYAPYSNECPISGHTESVITRTGVNMLNASDAEIGTAWNGASNSARARLVIPCKPSTQYTLSLNGTNGMDAIMMTDSATVPASISGGGVTFPKTFTTGATSKYIIIAFNKTSIAQTDVDALKLQLELGSTASAYEAYDGTSVTINLNGTRYGGTVDALTGVMTVTWKPQILDGNIPISNDGYRNLVERTNSYTVEYGNYRNDGAIGRHSIPSDKFAPYKTSSLTNIPPYHISTATDLPRLYLSFPKTYDTLEKIQAWFGNNPTQVVYPLVSLTTVQLTPVELSLLLGKNNIWTDAGILELNCSKINKPEIIISVNPESPESAKIFDFDFKIPQGKPGEKGDTPIIGVSTSVTTLEHDVEPIVSITTLNENEFRFDFGIPVGYTPEMTATISTTDLPNGSTASATVNVEQNNLNFHFGIPQGLKGETGASINGFTFSSTNPETHENIYYANFTDGTSTLFEVPEGPMGYGYYQKLPFTSTNIEESDQYTWIEESNGSSTLIINRTENDFIPVNIYNSTNNNIAATFTLAVSTENYPFGSIQYNTNEKFDGILYYIGKAPVPQLRIGSVTTSSDGITSVSTNRDGYDTVLNFSFPIKGDKGDKGDKGENGKDGNGIASVEILSIEGLTTNYRITFTDETMTPFDFSVRNGRSGGNGEGGGGIDEVDLSDDSIIINTLPIKHGGTGATTSTQAWINLGGGESGKHPEDYYLKSTDAVIPTLDYTDSITSISTESYAGTTTFVARGDHVHNISLTTGDENGQVKIAGVNIDVKGLKSAAYTVTTNYYPSIGGNIPTMSVGGGERIDKISITNVDPGVGSQLANNNILFVYTGGGGYYTIVGDYTGDCLEYSNPHLCFTDDCPNDRCYNSPHRNTETCSEDCFDPKCFKDCFDEGETQKVRIIYDNTYIIRRDGTLVRYGSANEVYEVIGDAVIRRQDYSWGGVHYEAEDGYYYQIGEDEYIFVKALDTGYTCPNNCFNPNCPTDDCFETLNAGSCPNNCPANLPNPRCENNCFGGCYGNGCYGNCYGDDCFKVRCYGSCSNDGVCSYETCPDNSIGCCKYFCSAFACDKGGAPDQCPWFNCRNNKDTCFCAGYTCY